MKIFGSRRDLISSTIDATEDVISLVEHGVRLDFRRDAAATHPAVTSNDGTVNWSPIGTWEAAHFGILPGTDCAAAFEQATLACRAAGQRLHLRGAAAPYLVSDTVVTHVPLVGDGAGDGDGVGTVIQTTGAGTARRWHDFGGAADEDFSVPLLVAARAGITVSGIRLATGVDGPAWSHAVLFPGVRASGASLIATAGFTRAAVLFDLTWSADNTALTALHPAIRSDGGCAACFTDHCDLAGESFGLGILGTRREPDDVEPADWVWGPGGAAGFADHGSRLSGLAISAAAKTEARAVQDLEFFGTAVCAGGRPDMASFGSVDTVMFFGGTWDADEGNTARIGFASGLCRNIVFSKVRASRNTIWVDGVDTGATLTAGEHRQPFLDVESKDGNRWIRGSLAITPTRISPTVTGGAALGTSAKPFSVVNAQALRSRGENLVVQTDGGTIDFRVGDAIDRVSLGKDELRLFATEDEVGWSVTPGAIVPRADTGTSLGTPTANLALVGARRIVSADALSLESASDEVTAPTPARADSSERVATTRFVHEAIEPFATRAAAAAAWIPDDQRLLWFIDDGRVFCCVRAEADTEIETRDGAAWALAPLQVGGALGAAVVTSSIDTEGGRLWRSAPNGMFGWGVTAAPVSLTELDNLGLATGVYRVTTDYNGAGALPAALAGQGCIVEVHRYNAATISQTVYRQAAALAGGTWRRFHISGDWQPWKQITTAGVIGAVGVAAGSPSGDLFELVAGENGAAERRASGWMTCERPDLATPEVATPFGGLFCSADIVWTFPSEFEAGALPVVTVTAPHPSVIGSSIVALSETTVTFRLVAALPVTEPVTIRCKADGRWATLS
ncbi:pyocin knob domain-containing protein [Methylobrevis albus]|uniref:Uncharacterized protein n=1 Tax=Methylobrevis albus TaxID=2793297 RepID=A0A931HZK5_9HYPH|nr:pyocin knob domain-containing protein [Methylobrevis albus]MBH0236609.1 hypothetical protein [Methylobrevis albus]